MGNDIADLIRHGETSRVQFKLRFTTQKRLPGRWQLSPTVKEESSSSESRTRLAAFQASVTVKFRRPAASSQMPPMSR